MARRCAVSLAYHKAYVERGEGMRHIPNLKALYTPSGQPYTIGEPDKDEDGETQPLLDSDGAILHDGQGGILLKAHQIAPALDRWIDMTLAGVPAARATMKDVAHAGRDRKSTRLNSSHSQ